MPGGAQGTWPWTQAFATRARRAYDSSLVASLAVFEILTLHAHVHGKQASIRLGLLVLQIVLSSNDTHLTYNQ